MDTSRETSTAPTEPGMAAPSQDMETASETGHGESDDSDNATFTAAETPRTPAGDEMPDPAEAEPSDPLGHRGPHSQHGHHGHHGAHHTHMRDHCQRRWQWLRGGPSGRWEGDTSDFDGAMQSQDRALHSHHRVMQSHNMAMLPIRTAARRLWETGQAFSRGGGGGGSRRGGRDRRHGPGVAGEATHCPFFFGGGDAYNARGNDEDHAFAPPVDIFDHAASWTVHAALPGAKKEDVEVGWDAGRSSLDITGIVHGPGDEELLRGLVACERRVGLFERHVRLPPDTGADGNHGEQGKGGTVDEVDAAGITARMEDGILIVVVPKAEKEWTQVRKVDIE